MMPFGGSAALGIMSRKKPYLSVPGELVVRHQRLSGAEDSTSESNLVSALPEAPQFEVAPEDGILENKANIPVHENIASTAEGILEDTIIWIGVQFHTFCPLEALQPVWLTPEVYCTIPVFLIIPTLAARCLSRPQPAVVP
jgi:hypothetical protein